MPGSSPQRTIDSVARELPRWDSSTFDRDAAIESADIILGRSDPRDVVSIVRLARVTYRKRMQNLWCATGYNVLAIPLAAGVLYQQRVMLPPAVGAMLMSLSTVIVAIIARLLRLTSEG